MAIFMQSPGVQVIEKNVSATTPGASTTIGAYAGIFRWGPVKEPMLIDTETTLSTVFGTPNDATASSFFAVANFLSYTSAMWVNRIASVATPSYNASVKGSPVLAINNFNDYDGTTFSSNGAFAARYPGSYGNGLKVSMADSATFSTWTYASNFTSAPGTSEYAASKGALNDELHIVVVDTLGKFSGTSGTILEKYAFVSKASDAISYQGTTNYYPTVIANNSQYIYWLAHDTLNGANWGTTADAGKTFGNITAGLLTLPTVSGSWVGNVATVTYASTGAGTTPYAVGSTITVSGVTPSNYNGDFVVVSCNSTTVTYALVGAGIGAITVQGTISGVMNAAYAVTATGTVSDSTSITVTYATTTNSVFQVGRQVTLAGFTPSVYNSTFYVTACNATTVTLAASGVSGSVTVQGTVSRPASVNQEYLLSGGTDGSGFVDGDFVTGYNAFLDTQAYDVSLVVTGNASQGLARSVVQNIGDVRKDCVVFTSITATATGTPSPILGTSATRIVDGKAFKTFDSTYAVIDSGYKYQYDKYNDKYRWIALNSDTAGLCARVDATNDTWASPAGIVKGQIKGAVKLSWNPTQSERDQLYPYSINPVVNQIGQGTYLFGDKTATLKPSAFDRINVRRLFLVLEKSISNSAKYQLFELNDEITRMQFVASVEPLLRDIKGRRGIQEYRVICDETNNTPQVIQTNEFRGTILVKPLYSVNFITLTFTAVGASVDFAVAIGA